ncbi:MAG: endonuclease domain-containing protein [Solirubrobacterales bacterium]
MASVLAGGAGAYLARRSAAALWGFHKWTYPIELVRSESRAPSSGILGAPGLATRGRFRVIRSRNLGREFVQVHRGIPVTTVARTLLDMAAVLDEKTLRAAFNEADRKGLLRKDDLVHCVGASRGRRGAGRFRRLIESRHPETAITRSELEVMFLELCRNGGLPLPEINQTVYGYEVDCLWRDARLIVELDGFEFHQGRMAFLNDANRTKDLRGAGYGVHRFTYDMVKYESADLLALLRVDLDQN